MNTAYPSNLTLAQYELVSDLIPDAKPGGRPRTVDCSNITTSGSWPLLVKISSRELNLMSDVKKAS
jgi:hypothetical protein